MSAQDIEVVRRALEAFKDRDDAAWFAIASEDIAVYPRTDEPGAELRYDGHEGASAYVANWLSDWQCYTAEPLEYIEAGGYVIAQVREIARGASSGLRVEQTFTHAFRVEDGLVTEWRMFGAVEEALEAVAGT